MSTLFPSVFEEGAFWILVLAGILLKFYFMLRRGARYKDSERKNAEANFPTIGFLVTWIPLFAVPILIGYARILVLPDWLFYPGLALWIAGWLITSWAILSLGRFFGSKVRVLSDHKIVENGPYHFIRHPMHAGELLAFLGLGLALQSWAALLVALASYGIILAYRIPTEERFMMRELGNEYVQYMKRTKRLIPYIW